MTDNSPEIKVIIIPCSGIGKTYGSVSREAAYEVVENLRPEKTCLVALSLLVMGDEKTHDIMTEHPAITIDGCKLACATKMARASGGVVIKDYAVLDVYRRYRQYKPQGIADLNEGGIQLAHALAQEIALTVDSLTSTNDSTSPTGRAKVDGGQNG